MSDVAPTARAPGVPIAQREPVALISAYWGEGAEESTVVTRLVAGALARNATVNILHFVAPTEAGEPIADSVFLVHKLALQGARPLRAAMMRAALRQNDTIRPVPEALASELEALEGRAFGVPETLAKLSPKLIVLAGHHQPFSLDALGRRASARPRVLFLPLCSDLEQLKDARIARIVESADAIGSANPAEHGALASLFPDRRADLFPLELGLNLNRSAAAQGLFGVRFFGRYVLLIRSFPPGGPRYARTLTHELLRSVLGEVSVAEVDGDKWRIADVENTLELPVNPTRVNLWRLMAHALFTIDLRPQGPLGRETLESMLLGTPVIVPEASAASAHAQASSGGLWYRDLGELLDQARALMDDRLREQLAAQAAQYARVTHGDMDKFVRSMAELVDAQPGVFPRS